MIFWAIPIPIPILQQYQQNPIPIPTIPEMDNTWSSVLVLGIVVLLDIMGFSRKNLPIKQPQMQSEEEFLEKFRKKVVIFLKCSIIFKRN